MSARPYGPAYVCGSRQQGEGENAPKVVDQHEGEKRDQEWQVPAEVVADHVPGDGVADEEVCRLADELALARHHGVLPCHDQPEDQDQDHRQNALQHVLVEPGNAFEERREVEALHTGRLEATSLQRRKARHETAHRSPYSASRLCSVTVACPLRSLAPVAGASSIRPKRRMITYTPKAAPATMPIGSKNLVPK